MKASEWLTLIRTLPVTVVGLGISNLPLIDFLLSHGAVVTARDRKTRRELGALAADLESKGVALYLGDTYLDHITEDIIFRSPGLRPDLPPFREAIARGARLISEMELFLELTDATVLAITGSDGKTTTTTLTGMILEGAVAARGRGRVYVGGNIGVPLLSLVEEMTAEDYAVVELSSFQLQTLSHSPRRAAITNITPNHLNWHTGMEEYAQAKTNIYRHPGNELLVTNADNAATAALGLLSPSPVLWFSSHRHTAGEFSLRSGDRAVYEREGEVLYFDGCDEHPILAADDILLPGRHNLENYMTAIALTEGLATPEQVLAVAKSFHGVTHRLEPVATVRGVKYYNSSVDSTPTRTAAAISAMQGPLILICGGYDKNISFEPLADALCTPTVRAVVLTGATAPKIREVLRDRTEVRAGWLTVLEEPDFEIAVLTASDHANEGDTVLLSPACASFDSFRNFEERGKKFCEIVKELQMNDEKERNKL